MKTLYERLLPEVRASLDANESQYEASVTEVRKSLNDQVCWLGLTVMEVHRITMFTDMPWAKCTKETFQFGVNLIEQE